MINSALEPIPNKALNLSMWRETLEALEMLRGLKEFVVQGTKV